MNEALTELCGELKNWFEKQCYIGNFVIEDGVLKSDMFNFDLLNGQYVRIVGSCLNDGVYLYNDGFEGLQDESFRGGVWALAIPQEVLGLAKDIADWKDKYGDTAFSPFSSESLSASSYSYTKSESAGNGAGATWQNIFSSRMNRWRKI